MYRIILFFTCFTFTLLAGALLNLVVPAGVSGNPVTLKTFNVVGSPIKTLGDDGSMNSSAKLLAGGAADGVFNQVHATDTVALDKAQNYPSVEVAFSPDKGAETLVLKTIDSAKSSIRLAAYFLTSPSLVRSLVGAKQRGVDVAVLVDYKSNFEEARNNAPRHALNSLANAGIPIRTIHTYLIHHDKYIVVDGLHTETGSFNYTSAAAKNNSENVMVIWNNPQVAKQYMNHWQSRWRQGQDYHAAY